MLQRCSALRSGAISELWRPLLTGFAGQAWPSHCRSFASLPAEESSSSQSDLHNVTRFWWKDEKITARQGAKIVKQRLTDIGPQKSPHLMEVVKRVKTPEDAAIALDIAQQFALNRAHRQQHDGLSPQLSYLILKSITKVSVDKALEVLRRSPELQLTFNLPSFREIIVRASKAGDLKAMKSAFQLLQAAGIRPNKDTAFCILRACFDNGRPDLAVGYAREFEANKVELRPAMKEKIQQAEADIRQKRLSAKQENSAEEPAQGGQEQQVESAAAEGSTDGEMAARLPEAPPQPAEKQPE